MAVFDKSVYVNNQGFANSMIPALGMITQYLKDKASNKVYSDLLDSQTELVENSQNEEELRANTEEAIRNVYKDDFLDSQSKGQLQQMLLRTGQYKQGELKQEKIDKAAEDSINTYLKSLEGTKFKGEDGTVVGVDSIMKNLEGIEDPATKLKMMQQIVKDRGLKAEYGLSFDSKGRPQQLVALKDDKGNIFYTNAGNIVKTTLDDGTTTYYSDVNNNKQLDPNEEYLDPKIASKVAQYNIDKSLKSSTSGGTYETYIDPKSGKYFYKSSKEPYYRDMETGKVISSKYLQGTNLIKVGSKEFTGVTYTNGNDMFQNKNGMMWNTTRNRPYDPKVDGQLNTISGKTASEALLYKKYGDKIEEFTTTFLNMADTIDSDIYKYKLKVDPDKYENVLEEAYKAKLVGGSATSVLAYKLKTLAEAYNKRLEEDPGLRDYLEKKSPDFLKLLEEFNLEQNKLRGDNAEESVIAPTVKLRGSGNDSATNTTPPEEDSRKKFMNSINKLTELYLNGNK